MGSTFVRGLRRQLSGDLLDHDADEVALCLASDPDVVVAALDEDDVDVEGWETFIRCSDIARESCLLVFREGTRVAKDAPERHFGVSCQLMLERIEVMERILGKWYTRWTL